MTMNITNTTETAKFKLTVFVLALPTAPRLSPQTDSDELEELADYVEAIDKAVNEFREAIAAIAKDHGAPLESQHLASDADTSYLLCDLRDAAQTLAAKNPEPGYDRLTAEDYGIGGSRR